MKALSEIIVKSENETKNIGGLISRLLKAKDLITFEGDLGVGKTFLCKSIICLLYTSPSPRDRTRSRMPSSA